MDWNREIKHFGEVNAGKTLEFVFEYYGDWEYVAHNNSCGCTTSTWTDNKLTASFKTKDSDITKTMKSLGRYYTEASKIITVTLKKGDQTKKVTLKLEAVIYPSDFKL